jgi:type VI secretion system protein ImpG
MKNRSFNELVGYYQKEMEYLINEGNEFARNHNKAAKNIEWGANGSNDPHIQKMIESFAFLTGSIQQQIDSTSSKFNFHIINNICPLFTRSIPCSTIMKCNLSKNINSNEYGKRLEKGSRITADLENSNQISYKTIYDVDILPIEINNIEFINLRNFNINLPNQKSGIGIKISIKITNNLNTIDLLEMQNFDKIRFFIKSTDRDINLYELIYTYSEDASPEGFYL